MSKKVPDLSQDHPLKERVFRSPFSRSWYATSRSLMEQILKEPALYKYEITQVGNDTLPLEKKEPKLANKLIVR